jgi:hypothetical protein
VTVEQAREHILRLMGEHGGYVDRATIEADPAVDEDHEAISAAAHALATESSIIVGEEIDGQRWFPFSFMQRAD